MNALNLKIKTYHTLVYNSHRKPILVLSASMYHKCAIILMKRRESLATFLMSFERMFLTCNKTRMFSNFHDMTNSGYYIIYHVCSISVRREVLC